MVNRYPVAVFTAFMPPVGGAQYRLTASNPKPGTPHRTNTPVGIMAACRREEQQVRGTIKQAVLGLSYEMGRATVGSDYCKSTSVVRQ